jgi:hypothetical protein
MKSKSKNGLDETLSKIQEVLFADASKNDQLLEIRRICLTEEEQQIISVQKTIKKQIGDRAARLLMLELIMSNQQELDEDEKWQRTLLFNLVN